MKKMFKSCTVTILVVLFSVVSIVGFSADGTDKKENKKSELVVASLDVSGPSSLPEAKSSILRGELITINAQLKSVSSAPLGPFKIRFYLSRTQDGKDFAYEFDVFHDVSLNKSSSRNGNNKEKFDNFHDVSQDKSGNISVTGRYAFPFSVGAGYTYWVVAEASPDEKALESSENKTKAITVISVPCDQFESYIEGDTYNCPFKPGEED